MSEQRTGDLPKQREIKVPLLLLLLQRGGRLEPGETYAPLANFYHLADEQIGRLRADASKGTQWHNYVQFARQMLVDEGLLDATERGVWKLTGKGTEVARSLQQEPPWNTVRF